MSQNKPCCPCWSRLVKDYVYGEPEKFPRGWDIPGRAQAEKAGGVGPKSHAAAGVLWCLPSAKTTKGSLVSITGHNEPQGRQQLWPLTGVTIPLVFAPWPRRPRALATLRLLPMASPPPSPRVSWPSLCGSVIGSFAPVAHFYFILFFQTLLMPQFPQVHGCRGPLALHFVTCRPVRSAA